MVYLSSLIALAATFVGVLAAPAAEPEAFTNITAVDDEGITFGLVERSGTPSSTGTNNGYYYSWWTDGAAQATYTNNGGGSYSLSWSGNNGNLVGGKGWNPGSSSR